MNEKTYEIRLASADDIPAIVMIYDAVLTREEQGQYSIGWIHGIYPTADTAAKAVSCRDMFVLEANAKIIASAFEGSAGQVAKS
jgi:hypothetical protein